MKRKRVEDHKYCFPASSEDVECLICMDIMHDPCRLPCACERSFCRKCLEKLATPAGKVTCPHCAREREKKDISSCSRQWKKVLDAIPRRCPNDPACRHRRSSYQEITSHAATECAYREQTCPNEECGQTIKVKKMKDHLRLCRGKRCKNFIPPKFGCQEIGTQKEIEAHECKCGIPEEVLNQLRQLLKKKSGKHDNVVKKKSQL